MGKDYITQADFSQRDQVRSVEAAHPPGPPPIERRVAMLPYQWAAIPLLFVLPLLSAFGVLGDKTATTGVRGADLTLKVRYPSQLDYQVDETIDIAIHSAGGQPAGATRVEIDRAYLAAFCQVQITPEPSEANRRAYVVTLPELAPNGSQHIAVTMSGGDYWRHTGTIRASAGQDSATVRLTTVVFP